MSYRQIEELLAFVKESLPGGLTEDCEVTIEANPADICPEFLETIAAVGINRLSVGVQCVSEQVLEFLGRRADAATVTSALDCIKALWTKDVGRRFSADLISGLPFLSDEEFLSGVSTVLDSGADHVSLYSLMLEENTPLWRQVRAGKAPYSAEDIDRQWFLGREMLEKAGIMQYEVSNFARPGFESRHNTVYWHMDNFIGIGAGASGTVGNERWTGSCSIHDYLSGWQGIDAAEASTGSLSGGKSLIEQIPQEEEILDERTREYEFLMMGFRLRAGVSSSEYKRRFGGDLSERIGGEKGLFADWEKKDLAFRYERAGETFFSLTGEGLMLLNRFLVNL